MALTHDRCGPRWQLKTRQCGTLFPMQSVVASKNARRMAWLQGRRQWGHATGSKHGQGGKIGLCWAGGPTRNGTHLGCERWTAKRAHWLGSALALESELNCTAVSRNTHKPEPAPLATQLPHPQQPGTSMLPLRCCCSLSTRHSPPTAPSPCFPASPPASRT